LVLHLDGSSTWRYLISTPDFCIAGRSSLLAYLEISKKEWLVVKMKAFFSGCFGFVAMIFALGFFIQYPAVFWGILAVFVVVIILGFREGLRRREALSKPPVITPVSTDDDEEGDIRHHYDIGGTPMSISNPETIQNESMSFGDDEEHN
jgi:hypothetical protein